MSMSILKPGVYESLRKSNASSTQSVMKCNVFTHPTITLNLALWLPSKWEMNMEMCKCCKKEREREREDERMHQGKWKENQGGFLSQSQHLSDREESGLWKRFRFNWTFQLQPHYSQFI